MILSAFQLIQLYWVCMLEMRYVSAIYYYFGSFERNKFKYKINYKSECRDRFLVPLYPLRYSSWLHYYI
jgi:hypothetical protein